MALPPFGRGARPIHQMPIGIQPRMSPAPFQRDPRMMDPRVTTPMPGTMPIAPLMVPADGTTLPAPADGSVIMTATGDATTTSAPATPADPTTFWGWREAKPRWNGGEGWDSRDAWRDARMDWRDGFRDWRRSNPGWARTMMGQRPGGWPQRDPSLPVTPEGTNNALDALNAAGLNGVNPNSNFGRFWGG